MRRLYAIAALLCWMLIGLAEPSFADWRSDAIGDAFLAESVLGTMVIESLDGSVRVIHNEDRAAARFSPASTFKIVNTLIALDQGILASRNSTFTWDGVERDVPTWNQDQTLASAFAVSCVWCYQQIARRVGTGVYVSELDRLEYGNGLVGDTVDSFWLNGVLRISAREQIKVLRGVVSKTVPYGLNHLDELRAIMLMEVGNGYRLYAKSGWTGAELHTGWFVGYVESGGQTWLFAMNLDMYTADEAPLRKDLVLRAFRALGLI
jgi:beta-lactamase class D